MKNSKHSTNPHPLSWCAYDAKNGECGCQGSDNGQGQSTPPARWVFFLSPSTRQLTLLLLPEVKEAERSCSDYTVSPAAVEITRERRAPVPSLLSGLIVERWECSSGSHVVWRTRPWPQTRWPSTCAKTNTTFFPFAILIHSMVVM